MKRLDLVTVKIGDEGGVVGRLVCCSQARRPHVLTSGGKGRGIKCIDRRRAWRDEGNVEAGARHDDLTWAREQRETLLPAVDRMAADMAHDLRDHGVAAVALYPGLVRTEAVMKYGVGHYDMSNSESPEFTGRAVAALAADPNVITKSGRALVAAELALEYGFADIDGKQPRPLTMETS